MSVATELGYVIYAALVRHSPWSHWAAPLIYVLLFGLLAAARGRIRWITKSLRLLLAWSWDCPWQTALAGLGRLDMVLHGATSQTLYLYP